MEITYKAHLWSVVRFVPHDPIPKFLRFAITSDSCPTTTSREVWGMILMTTGPTFQHALDKMGELLQHHPFGRQIELFTNLGGSRVLHDAGYELGRLVEAQFTPSLEG